MGMFTEVRAPEIRGGHYGDYNDWIQFKTGNDTCERYELGQVLECEICPEDDQSDIFWGLGRTITCDNLRGTFKDYFVVVMDKRIVAVIPSISINRDNIGLEEQLLRLFYNINPQLTWEDFIDYVQKPHWYHKLWQRVWPWSEKNKQRRKCKKIDWEEFGKNMCNPIKQ